MWKVTWRVGVMVRILVFRSHYVIVKWMWGDGWVLQHIASLTFVVIDSVYMFLYVFTLPHGLRHETLSQVTILGFMTFASKCSITY